MNKKIKQKILALYVAKAITNIAIAIALVLFFLVLLFIGLIGV